MSRHDLADVVLIETLALVANSSEQAVVAAVVKEEVE